MHKWRTKTKCYLLRCFAKCCVTNTIGVIVSCLDAYRFHQVVWGAFGSDTDQNGLTSGVIVGGADNGSVLVYSAQKMIAGKEDCTLLQLAKHTGAVKALDFNPFQNNLIASGAAESEIYIWDLNKPDNPMTPGQKSQVCIVICNIKWVWLLVIVFLFFLWLFWLMM